MRITRSTSIPRSGSRRRIVLSVASAVLALIASACSSLPVTRFSAVAAPVNAPSRAVEWFASPTADGHEVQVAVAHAAGSGTHPTLLILPGSDGLRDDYVQLAQEFAAKGFDTVTGCWFAATNTADPTSVACTNTPAFTGVSESAVSTVDALISAAKAATGVDDAHLGILGYSRGGGIALLHAARTGARYPIVDVAGMVTGQVAGGALATDVNVVASAPAIGSPVLVLHGVADGIVAPSQSDALVAALGGASARASITWLQNLCDGPCNHNVLAFSASRTAIIADASTWLHGRIG